MVDGTGGDLALKWFRKDEKLDELSRELIRAERNLDECDPASWETCYHEWKAAEARLELYFKEMKEKDHEKDSCS